MKTSEDVLESGLYMNDCCGQQLIFDLGDTFCRCPKCQRLSDWELESKIVEVAGYDETRRHVKRNRSQPSSTSVRAAAM